MSDVATAIRHEGGEAIAVTGDVTSFDHLEAIRHQIEESLGPVDILVANAGGSFTPPAPLEEIPEEGWRATIDGPDHGFATRPAAKRQVSAAREN